MKLRSENARPTARGSCSSGGTAGLDPHRERDGNRPDGREGDRDTDGLGHGAEHRPEDGSEDRGAEGVPISSPRRARGVATVNHASAPAHVTVLEALDEAGAAGATALGGGEGGSPGEEPRPVTTASFGP